MWQQTTDVGCDYAICEKGPHPNMATIVVSCNYGPWGNMGGTNVFEPDNFCSLSEAPAAEPRPNAEIKTFLEGLTLTKGLKLSSIIV